MSLERESLESYLAQLEERIRNLETSPRITATSQRGGTFTLIPEDGAPAALLKFGQVVAPDSTTQYGVTIYDSQGRPMLMAAEAQKGLVWPAIGANGWSKANDNIAITSGAYATAWTTRFENVSHDVLKVKVTVGTDAATTGSVRLFDLTSGLATDAYVTTANTLGTITFLWKHPAEVGWAASGQRDLELRVQVKRDSGAGALNIYQPVSLFTSSYFETSASTTGSPTFV